MKSTTSSDSPRSGTFCRTPGWSAANTKAPGRKKGHGGKKIGNGHLKWAFSEGACLLLRCHEPAKRRLQRKEKKCGKAKALGILAAKLGRTVYHMWRKQAAFDAKKFLTS